MSLGIDMKPWICEDIKLGGHELEGNTVLVYINYSDTIDKFVTSFGNVHEKFDTTYTNKIHIIQDHLKY